MVSETFHFKFLGYDDGPRLTDLRILAYQQRYGSAVDLSALPWTHRLPHALNLGVYLHQPQAAPVLCSAYRLDVIEDREALHGVLQTRFDGKHREVFDFVESFRLPTIVSCRAVTLPAFANRDLHLALRYWSVRILNQIKAPEVVSTFESSNRWSEELREMGYETKTNPSNWSKFLRNQSSPVVARLDLASSGQKAELALEQRLRKALPDVSFKTLQDFDIERTTDPIFRAWLEVCRTATRVTERRAT